MRVGALALWMAVACGGGHDDKPADTGATDSDTRPTTPAGTAPTTGSGTPSDTGCEPRNWHTDDDGDGHGHPDRGSFTCDPPPGHVLADDDCDDTDPSIHPGMFDPCGDGIDQDCDGVDDACGPLTGDIQIDDALATITGVHPDVGDQLAIGAPGDLDGDGVDDLVLATTRTLPDVHAPAEVAVIAGPAAGHRSVDLSDRILTAGEKSLAGSALDASADANGDGFDDLLVGVPEDVLVGGGAVALLHGRPDLADLPELSDVDVVLRGKETAGMAAAWGDIDGDGVPDALVAATRDGSGGSYDYNEGAVHVFYGPIAEHRHTDGADLSWHADGFGHPAAFATGRDVTGDGVDDLVVGSGGSSATHVFAGPIRADAFTEGADRTLLGRWRPENDLAGDTVAMAADLTGDGVDDLVIGAPLTGSAESGGAAYVVAGGAMEGDESLDAAFLTIVGDDPDARAGAAVTAGDLDGDGLGELAVGGPGADLGAGLVGLWRGSVAAGTQRLSEADLLIRSDRGLGIGVDVRIVDDVTGDAYGDLLVLGTGHDSDDGEDVGQLLVFRGP